MFMDEKNLENNGEAPVVNNPEGEKETVSDTTPAEAVTPVAESAPEPVSAPVDATDMPEPAVIPAIPSEVNASAKFNLLPYLAVVVSILVVGAGLIFVLEKQDRISTGLFTGVINSMEDSEPVAKVNNATITKKDFDSSFDQLKDIQAAQGVDISDLEVQAQLKTQAIDTLVNAEILRQEAIEQGFTAEAENIDARYNEIKDGLGGAEVLEARMAEFGVTEESLRRDIENEFLIQQLFDANLPATESIEISQEEVQAIYNQAGGVDAGLPPLEEVRDQIEQRVRQDKEQQAIAEYIDTLRNQAEVEVLI